MLQAPDRTEAAPYYFTYIDQVGPGDVRDLMDVQGVETLALLRGSMASGYAFSVRALAYITVGHVTHHVRLLKERYLSERRRNPL